MSSLLAARPRHDDFERVDDLFGGRHAGQFHDPVFDVRFQSNLCVDAVSGLVFADNAYQYSRAFKRGDVAGYVTRASKHCFFGFLKEYRHRRFGRNAPHTSVNETVQHDVAHHDDAAPLEQTHETGNCFRHTMALIKMRQKG